MKTAIHVICSALILSIVISIGILGSVPPVDRDPLTHHLYVPKLYLKHGGIYEIPAVEFSYFPMNLDLLYTVALYFGSDILPKYLHFAFVTTDMRICYIAPIVPPLVVLSIIGLHNLRG